MLDIGYKTSRAHHRVEDRPKEWSEPGDRETPKALWEFKERLLAQGEVVPKCVVEDGGVTLRGVSEVGSKEG